MADAKIVLTAEDKTRAAFESAKSGLTQVGSLAAAAGFSLASLGSAATLAGLVNMVKSAANGIDAMNDLKDATGASIENISALEGVALRTGANFDTVSTSLIKFNQALGSTIKPGSDAEKVIKAIGLNAKELRDMDPAEALRVTAVALNQFADDGNKARAVQELFGKSLKEVAPYLKDLAESGELVARVTTKQAEEAEKFNKELFKLGETATDVSRAIANPLISKMNELVDGFRQGQKEGEGFLGALGRIGTLAGAFTISGQLSMLLGLIPGVKAGGANGYTSAREGIDNINIALKDTSLRESEINALLAERVRLQAKLGGYLNSTAGAGRGMGGYEGVAKGSLELPQETAVKKAAKATKELTEAEKDRAYHAAFMHKQTLAAYDAERKAMEDNTRAHLAMQELREQGDRDALVDIEERIAELDREERQYGMLESQIVAVTRAQLEQAREGMYLAGEDIEAVNQRIDAYRRLEERLQGRELREANERGAATAATAWSTVGDAFVDNLMRGGKSVAQYLKDLFRTLVLRPLLQPVGNMMQGAMNSIMGGGSSMAGGASSGSSMLSTAGSILGLSTGVGAAGATFGSGLGAGLAALTGEAGIIGGLSAGVTSIGAGSIAAGLGTIAGVLGPLAIGVAILASFVKDRGGPKADGAAGAQLMGGDMAIGAFDNSLAPGVIPVVQGLQTSYDTLAKQFGTTAAIQFGIGISRDPKGTAPTFMDVVARGAGGSLVYNSENRNVGRSDGELETALKDGAARALLAALQASDLPAEWAAMFDSIGDGANLSADEIEASINRISGIQKERTSLEATLFDLTATDLEKLNKIRDAERAAVDASNLPLLEQIYALQDLATAAADSAESTQDAADALAAAQASSDAYLASWAAIDKAQSSAAAASSQFIGSVMASVQDKWAGLFKGIKDEIAAIRGQWSQDLSAAGFQSAQAQYQQALQTIAAGGKGAVQAAESLPALARQLLMQGAAQATSRIDLLTLQAATAQQLQDTVDGRNSPLRQLQRIQTGQLGAALSGRTYTGREFKATSVNDYGASWAALSEQVRSLGSKLDRLTDVSISGVLKMHQVGSNTRELVERGVQVLPALDGSVIVTTT